MKKFNSKEELRNYLIKVNEAYRIGNPIISDAEYDTLEGTLRTLDSEDSFLNKIDDCDFGKKKKLSIHMGSQHKALNLDDMKSFIKNTKGQTLNVSEKLDGASCELTYEDGIFIQALTRGNGKIGVDITTVVQKVQSVPKKINTTGVCIVRGELMMAKSQLVKLNEQLEKDGRETMSNTRNGTVGIVKSLRNLSYAKFLMFKSFDILQVK